MATNKETTKKKGAKKQVKEPKVIEMPQIEVQETVEEVVDDVPQVDEVEAYDNLQPEDKLTEVIEEIIEKAVPVKEEKEEVKPTDKRKIISKIPETGGYCWNGQEMDF